MPNNTDMTALCQALIAQPDVQMMQALAARLGGEARLVGGVVRDAVLGTLDLQGRLDLDMAVNLPITEVADGARDKGYRVIETGLAFGSVTIIADAHPIEITQTRADLETDGRHATIGFQPDWLEDAKRRDFTMNALYLQSDGQLYDPLGGCDDIAARCLRFIGVPQDRIAEDYLRILRAIRFLATYPTFTMPADDYAALQEAKAGVATLSAERKGHEMRRLLQGPAWRKGLTHLHELGLDEAAYQISLLSRPACDEALPNEMARLAAYLTPSDIPALDAAMRLSKVEKTALTTYLTPLSDDELVGLAGEDWQRFAYHAPPDIAVRAALAWRADAPYPSGERLRQIAHFAPPPCPVTGHDLIEAGIEPGVALGAALQEAQALFIASRFTATTAELVAQLRDKSA